VSKWVKDTFGIAYTPTGMVDLLNPNRLYLQEDYRGSLCEADAEGQKAFVQMIKSASELRKRVIYADGTHLTHNTRFTYAWIKKGKGLEHPTVSGRDPSQH